MQQIVGSWIRIKWFTPAEGFLRLLETKLFTCTIVLILHKTLSRHAISKASDNGIKMRWVECVN